MISEAVNYGLDAFLMTFSFIIILEGLAKHIGLLDHPGGRKHHDGAVPLSGGLAMTLSFLLMILLFDPVPSAYYFDLVPSGHYISLLAGALALGMVGALDDLYQLSVRSRFVAQALVVLICMVMLGEVQLTSVGNLLGLGDIQSGYAAIPLTIFCIVGVLNAFNFIDGIDGLAGGLAIIALSAFGAVAFVGNRLGAFTLLVPLIGIVLGFLSFNFRTHWRARASVFMGSCGNMFLGFILCWFALDLSQGEQQVISPITAVWILGLPILDTVNVVVNRLMRGESPFVANRDHIHHLLLMQDFSPKQTVQILLAMSAIMAGIGLIGGYMGVSEGAMCAAFVGLYVSYFFVSRILLHQPIPVIAPGASLIKPIAA
jgi:UDP-GlcNAc:undecaprenyl-phosphate/decaprenyl-phosphate GlcNAc-1-phosphate transferase